MNRINDLPVEEIHNSRNELELIDKTNILGKLNPFISNIFGIMNYLNIDKDNSIILEAGSNPVGDSNIHFLSPNVHYFFANHPSIIEYYGFDMNIEENYISFIKEQIEDNESKCEYTISKEEMLENMKKQLIFSYESFQQKKEEIEKEGKIPIIISSFVLGSTFSNKKHFENDFWNLDNSLQIHRFALDDFVKNHIDEQEHNFIAKTPYVEVEYQDFIKNKMKLFSQNSLKNERDRASFLEQKLQNKYSTNRKYNVFDCPFEEGYSIAICNSLK